MMLVRPFAAVGALIFVVAPLALVGAQPDDDADRPTSRVTFYGHVFGSGLGQPMPANTEPPIGEENFGLGSFDWCTPAGNFAGLPPLPSEGTDCNDDPLNKLALYSSAGFVDVKNRPEFQQNGQWELFHNERGQTKAIALDTSQNIEATIYLTLDLHSWPVTNQYGTNCLLPHPEDVPCVYPYWGWDPGVQKDFIVDATLYMAVLGEHGGNASNAPAILEALPTAEIVAQGRVGPMDVTNGLPGAPVVNQFTIDLGPPMVSIIPPEKSFFLVYSFYSETSGNQYGLHTWRIWSGELFPPTFVLPVKNAFDVERVIPNFAHGKLALLGVMNTPWGSYDISPRSVDLTITDSNGAEIEPEHMQRFGEFSVAHGGHYLPINITWIWDYQADKLKAGTYTATLSAGNFQNSAHAACTATFELKDTSRGLVPGKVQEGVCGAQSASEEFLEGIREGSTTTGGS